MIGAWPISLDRLLQYMQKATREAKRFTSWITPNEPFDKALQRFLEKITTHKVFVSDFESFVKPLIEPGRISSLSQALLKMTVPGVPDLYQGTELWDLSLVDPDNRRPVDYASRQTLLSELASLTSAQIWARQDEGLPKLWLTQQCLRVRRENAAVFGASGSYKPLKADGEKAAHVAAFTRGAPITVVAQRLPLGVNGNWSDTAITLPKTKWRNFLTREDNAGGVIFLRDLLSSFPVALLVLQN